MIRLTILTSRWLPVPSVEVVLAAVAVASKAVASKVAVVVCSLVVVALAVAFRVVANSKVVLVAEAANSKVVLAVVCSLAVASAVVAANSKVVLVAVVENLASKVVPEYKLTLTAFLKPLGCLRSRGFAFQEKPLILFCHPQLSANRHPSAFGHPPK